MNVHKRLTAALLAAVLLLVLCACGTPQNETADYTIREAVYPQTASNTMEANYVERNDSAGGFFPSAIRTFLSDAQGENKVCSPLNLYMALAMLAELTDGTSRQQVLDLLGCADLNTLRTQTTALWNANYCDNGQLTSILASSLWLDQEVNFIPSTLDTLADIYHASSFQGTMGDNAFNKALQDWVNQQTGGLLEEQAAGLEMSPGTVLALATTVYFQGRWYNEFFPSDTIEGIFHGAQEDMPCDFMYQSTFRAYFTGEHFSAVAQDIYDNEAMWLILPEEGSNPDALLQEEELYAFLSAGYEWEQVETNDRVNLSLPKFDVASNLDLIDDLRALGITDALDPSLADFSPTTADGPLYLSQVKHAARVTIDEEGCTAAAFTVPTLAGSALPDDEIDFILDRPFLFVITSQDGLPLFAGVVNQP